MTAYAEIGFSLTNFFSLSLPHCFSRKQYKYTRTHTNMTKIEMVNQDTLYYIIYTVL